MMIHDYLLEALEAWAEDHGYRVMGREFPKVVIDPRNTLIVRYDEIRGGYQLRMTIITAGSGRLSLERKIVSNNPDPSWGLYADYVRGVILEGLGCLWGDYCSKFGTPPRAVVPGRPRKQKVVV